MSSSFNLINVWKYLADDVNKSQFFNPLFSWIVVSYTYYAIGRRGGAIWKYLFIVVTFGGIANVIHILKTYAYESNYYLRYVKYLNWVDTYFYGLNEWGFVFINFTKIRACVNILKHKFWTIFMYILLIYITFCRSMIAYYKVDEDYTKYFGKFNGNPNVEINEKSTRFHAALYIPLGVIELILILCVIIQFIKKSNPNRQEFSSLLQSTLFRMLLISITYIFIAIDVLFENEGFILFSRRALWRIKGIFGLVFLVDLLLLRIDIDTNTIRNQKAEIEKNEKIIALSSISKTDDYGSVVNSNSIYFNDSKKVKRTDSMFSQSPLIPHNPSNNIFNYNSSDHFIYN